MQMMSYISESKILAEMQQSELENIVRSSNKRNAQLGISGVLFLRGNTFFQTFEGPDDAMKDLYKKIVKDDRHEHMYLLMNERIKQRRFSEWAMECFLPWRLEADW